MNGIINFFKPKGMTSHGAVNFIRKTLGIKRVGHTGTLDPEATGVLPICIGKATRISQYLLEADKEYIAELTLGHQTDTQDSKGNIIAWSDETVTEDEIMEVFHSFKNKKSQIPPMYSALKHKGKKLYELAREGKTIERKPRPIKIYHLNVLNIIDGKKITFHIKCSKGTYVRTICNDIGLALGTYGYMSALTRTAVGPFKLADSVGEEYFQDKSPTDLKDIILPADQGLYNLESIKVDKKHFKRLTNGVLIPISNGDLKINKELKVYCSDKFIGIGRILIKDNEKLLKMDKVLI